MRNNSNSLLTLGRRKRRQGGFTMMEVVLALTIFTMMTLMFAAVFPVAVRAAQSSSYYNQAAQLTQHKLDQMRSAGYSVVRAPGNTGLNNGITLLSLGIVDTGSVASSTSVPYTATFTSIDNLAGAAGYFPPGATGTVTVQDVTSVNPTLTATAGTIYYVTVTIQWPGNGTLTNSYSASSLIAAAGDKS